MGEEAEQTAVMRGASDVASTLLLGVEAFGSLAMWAGLQLRGFRARTFGGDPPRCNGTCIGSRLGWVLRPRAAVPQTAARCGFQRIQYAASNSVRRIRSNPAGHVVLQSGTEWVSVAN